MFLWTRRAILPLALAITAGCATYKEDLRRATDHYNRNQFEPALALLRVLEDDVDSLSDADRAQYAYIRGMTDYRLSGLQQQGTGIADPAKAYRLNARHWLAVAAAIEKNHAGGLTAQEKKHLDDALAELNHEVFGGAEPNGDAPSAELATTGSPAEAQPSDPATASPAAVGSSRRQPSPDSSSAPAAK